MDADVLEFSQDLVGIVINGLDLITVVKAHELLLTNAEGHQQIAGAYQHLPPYELLDNVNRAARSNRAVLACTCGAVECWSLTLRVKKARKSLIWSHFKQPHRPLWDYSALGELRFEVDNYREQMRFLQEYAALAEAERTLRRERRFAAE